MDLFMLGLLALAVAVSPFISVVVYLLNRDRSKRLESALTRLSARVDALERGGRAGVPAATGQPFAVAGSGTTAPVGAPSAAAERVAPPASTLARPVAASGVESAVPPSVAPADSSSPPPAARPGTPATPADSSLPPVAQRHPSPPRAARSSAEWEELIGASWMNKIGVVVTLVGMVLALGYSVRYLGPEGRIVVALAISGGMLGLGAIFERRERYRRFARGLIGGGWAGLYFTTFAMHGVEAARIIESPVVGTLLLMAVAVGMVLHSLAYKSATVTGLAYFMTFATLALVPVSRFALAASLPAAASLLLVARWFRWRHMMVAGVVFTYGAYLARSGSPDVGLEDWAFGQALLCVYWLMFEAFDLLSLQGRRSVGWTATLMPLNAAGFVGASLLGWSAAHPDKLWLFFLSAAAMLIASAMVRARWHTGDFADDDVAGRLRGSSYEVQVLIAAVLMALSIVDGFEGWRRNVAWLLEAQLLIVAGVVLKNRFLRHIGSGVLAIPVVHLLTDDLVNRDTFGLVGRTWFRWTPLALLTAVVLYFDRALVRGMREDRVAGAEHSYNWIATTLVAAVLALELPDPWVAPSWLALGLSLIALSKQRAAWELFVQGYIGCCLAWLVTMLFNVPTDEQVFGLPARWATALPVAALLYGLGWAARHIPDAEDAGAATRAPIAGMNALAQSLVDRAAPTLFAAATLLTSWFLLFEVSGSWLTVAWGLQGVALLAVGFAGEARGARLAGLSLLGLCICKLFLYDLNELEALFRIYSFIVLGVLLLVVSFAYSRYREEIRRLL